MAGPVVEKKLGESYHVNLRSRYLNNEIKEEQKWHIRSYHGQITFNGTSFIASGSSISGPSSILIPEVTLPVTVNILTSVNVLQEKNNSPRWLPQ